MSFSTTVHVPVLIQPILAYASELQPRRILDGTLGGGGHTLALARLLPPDGKLIACDRDPAAIEAFQRRLLAEHSTFTGRVHALHCSYDEVCEQKDTLELLREPFDLILLDLGLSSDQLADVNRGFSFRTGGELDLRFDPNSGQPAWEVLQTYDEKEIADILFQLGEERFSRRIAARVCRQRAVAPIKTAEQFRELILASVPGTKHGRIDPATRSFQALRIFVNDELGILSRAMRDLPTMLKPGGLLQVISFHSLEDRIVKNAFRDARDLELVARKPLVADDREVEQNPRSRSAKLRIARKLSSDQLKPAPALSDADYRRHR